MIIVDCKRCGKEAIAIFFFSEGCYCDESKVQALCLHHAMKSGPPDGGTMQLMTDLTQDFSFGPFWHKQRGTSMSEAAEKFVKLCEKIIALQKEVDLLRAHCYDMWYNKLVNKDFDDVYHIASEAEI